MVIDVGSVILLKDHSPLYVKPLADLWHAMKMWAFLDGATALVLAKTHGDVPCWGVLTAEGKVGYVARQGRRGERAMIRPGDVVSAPEAFVMYERPPRPSGRKLKVVRSHEMTMDLCAFHGGAEGMPTAAFLVLGFGDRPGTLRVLSASGDTGILEEKHASKV